MRTTLNDSMPPERKTMKKEKRKKFHSLSDDLDFTSEKNFKKKKLINLYKNHSPNNQFNKSAYCSETKNYIKVTAQPDDLSPVPHIFHFSSPNNKNANEYHSFSLGVLSAELQCSGKEKRFQDNIKLNSNYEPVKRLAEWEIKQKFECKPLKEGVSQVKKPKIITTPFCKTDASMDSVDAKVGLKTTSYADFYEISNKNAFIFHLHHPCQFSFNGELIIKVLAGEIEILGFKLNAFSNWEKVSAYSPRLCTSMVVETIPKNFESFSTNILKENLKEFLPENKLKQLLKYLKPNDAILYIEQEASFFGPVIYRYMELPLFPKDLEDCSSVTESISKKLQATFKFDLSATREDFIKNPKWDNIKLNKLSVICGGKGVGKSTLLKFYVNRFLSMGEKVVILDLDPGQAEFTPPGFVSAVIVNKPLLGPNFTHPTEGEMMVYYGSINTNQSPSKYLECVNYIVQWHRNNKELSEMKCLVNTMGFCKGLGVEIMISVLKIIGPDTVIQVQDSNELNNYPFELTQKLVNSKKGFGSMIFNEHLSYNFWTVNASAHLTNKSKQSELIASEIRNIMMASYFSGMLNSSYDSFNSVRPYVVPFSNLYLGIENYIKPNDVLKAFNGNIVSLSCFCRTTEVVLSTESENDAYCKIVLKPCPVPSFGLGFVRGIDCYKKKFYIITPLSLEKLGRVNCLTLGNISPPDFLFLKQETVEMPTIYTSVDSGLAAKKVKRVFRKLKVNNQ